MTRPWMVSVTDRALVTSRSLGQGSSGSAPYSPTFREPTVSEGCVRKRRAGAQVRSGPYRDVAIRFYSNRPTLTVSQLRMLPTPPGSAITDLMGIRGTRRDAVCRAAKWLKSSSKEGSANFARGQLSEAHPYNRSATRKRLDRQSRAISSRQSRLAVLRGPERVGGTMLP